MLSLNPLIRIEVWLTIEQKSFRKAKYSGVFGEDIAAKYAMGLAKKEGLCVIRRIYFNDDVRVSRVEYIGAGRTTEINTVIN